ncbi:MAG: 3-methylcrotonyl-CoA carboxylase [Gammaproteobacteria bacterium]|nr:MAG: 3-methylcrotonyl-CoA carboxylase [Gammaproteobacteria bacterium]
MNKTPFDSILIANRGEIAVRVIRCAKSLGYRTIAVYSEADAEALHVQLADEAYLLGPAPVAESYLNVERVLAAVAKSGAQAVHPGYGFLSENAEFAKACEAQGVVFIGPSVEAIASMGNKAEAKRRMLEAGVPCVPGYQSVEQTDERLLSAAEEIGVPLMVKAAAGGGGRGMRLVESLQALPGALKAARSEAQNAFGSDELILEKAVLRPRHVEVQVFGDKYGNVIHLGERDCSVQRRHQKVIEEAPCPVMDDELRARMGQAAVDAAKAINYTGAGTVEFLLDDSGHFYFLEMNTRLQVEHPVTEMITGLDLVALQFRVAEGEPLGIQQDDVVLNGHAIEVRLYAEDASNDFLPAAGHVLRWQVPEGEGVRADYGLQSGQAISPFYDPMVAKIIAWGADRNTARRRLIRALDNTVLFGVENNRRFLIAALQNPVFASGEATTAFIGEQFAQGFEGEPVPAISDQILAACLLQQRELDNSLDGHSSMLSAQLGLRGSRDLAASYRFFDDAPLINISQRGEGAFDAVADGQQYVVNLSPQGEGAVRIHMNDTQWSAYYSHRGAKAILLQSRGIAYSLFNTLAFTAANAEQGGSGQVTAPMHGNLMALLVQEGDTVSEGQELAVMEAMKMEHRLRAEKDGTVVAISATIGEQLAAGAVVLTID